MSGTSKRLMLAMATGMAALLLIGSLGVGAAGASTSTARSPEHPTYRTKYERHYWANSWHAGTVKWRWNTEINQYVMDADITVHSRRGDRRCSTLQLSEPGVPFFYNWGDQVCDGNSTIHVTGGYTQYFRLWSGGVLGGARVDCTLDESTGRAACS